MQEHANLTANILKHKLWSPERRFSDKFSDEDIERAWRRAYEKVGEFVMPEERKN